MLLIVNADDLGTSEAINNKIFDLMECGLVTSSTIMANAPAFEHAVQRIKSFPQCSFGVHLNLTVFRPITRSKAIEPILDEAGCLSIKYFHTHFTAELYKAVQEELVAQVQKVYDAGISVSHFDSHHHVHTKPQLFFAVKVLQKRFGVRKVRATINLLPPGQRPSLFTSFKKKIFILALRKIWATRSPDGLCDFIDYYNSLKAGSSPPFRSIELMVHPGAKSDYYEKEIEILKSENWRNLLPMYASIGNYHSL